MYLNNMRACSICPRACGANREQGQVGFCGAGSSVRLARAAPHFWEEPCISGSKGSGAVFFSHCNLKCVFCQNEQISKEGMGENVTSQRLAEIFLELQHQQVHNINLVTATPYLFFVVRALKQAKKSGLTIPVVYNCSGYHTLDEIKMLDGLIDVYLPDFKFFSGVCSLKYAGAKDYPNYAWDAIAEMVRQRKKVIVNADGIMICGVMVRHLVLPQEVMQAKQILSRLYCAYGNHIYYSIMSQYTPPKKSCAYRCLERTLFDFEYKEVMDFAQNIGITNGFIQQTNSASLEFVPHFNGLGV